MPPVAAADLVIVDWCCASLDLADVPQAYSRGLCLGYDLLVGDEIRRFVGDAVCFAAECTNDRNAQKSDGGCQNDEIYTDGTLLVRVEA